MGLVTNGDAIKQREKIDRFDLELFFDSILIEGEIGRGKPDPQIFTQAMSQLGTKASETWMVGDHLIWDVEGAQSVGIFAIWHDWEKAGLPAETKIKPDFVIHRINELGPV